MILFCWSVLISGKTLKIPAVKATAPSSLRPTVGLWLAPDPLLTPVRDCPSPALPPADLPENAGGPWRRPRGSKSAGPGSSGRERSSRYLLQPRSLAEAPATLAAARAPPPPSRLTRPWPGPNAAPTHPEPRASENPLQAGAGRTYHMQLHLGTSTSGGVSAHSSSYSRSMRNPPLRGPEGGAGERAGGETEAKTPPSSACALGALYNGGGGGGGGGRQRRRKPEAGGGGALTERAAASAPALAVQE
ncbi:unnamed protein product [Rangifer tarandus platyrhynchus]|uniref:Uncharacterized protein n=2 Tax=Rangifer tarandus platyrhynchus TaxID=3082113 RepID=A0ABN8ZPE3_RANTA|nr:unnamed protein product [Rangifer tarandus platyrhynchus]CAI9706543.1 unnamed protein product [Rangifer tarandus platyrhynchus]